MFYMWKCGKINFVLETESTGESLSTVIPYLGCESARKLDWNVIGFLRSRLFNSLQIVVYFVLNSSARLRFWFNHTSEESFKYVLLAGRR